MNPPLSALTSVIDNAPAPGEDARIARFLDAIIVRLAPLPAEFHDEVRRELRDHLGRLIVAHEELGATQDEAIGAAMRQFGDSKRIAQRYRQAWRQTEAYVSPWAAMRLALGLFSGAMLAVCGVMAALCEIMNRTYWRGGTPGSLVSFLFFLMLVGVPLLVGARVGWRSHLRASFGTFCALALLTAATLPLCLLGFDTAWDARSATWYCDQLCSTVGPLFVLWLPTGWLAASVAGIWRTRRLQYRRGRRWARG